jgi:alpha-tubulin suppressor-like RCC1 family protein
MRSPLIVLVAVAALAGSAPDAAALVAPAGGGLAWGQNDAGQLGDGTTTDRSHPVSVTGLSPVVAVAGGQGHSVAVRSDGTVWAWGGNAFFGALGNGGNTNSSTPVQVIDVPGSPLTGIVTVAAGHWPGGHHTLALRGDGTVWAWGGNGSGQLGDGTTTNRNTAVPVSGLTDVVAIAAGSGHSLAVLSDGTVWAWGSNSAGELGDGTTTGRTTPVRVSGLTGVVAVTAGSGGHSLALLSDGTVWGWGANYAGQLGNGTSSPSATTTPGQVSGLTGAVGIAAGRDHSLALLSDGTVWAWGGNGFGQLGDGSTTDRHDPVAVSGLPRAMAVSAGSLFTVALGADGTVWAWGENGTGQLGDGTTTNRTTPGRVVDSGGAPLTGVGGVEAGGYFTLGFGAAGATRAVQLINVVNGLGLNAGTANSLTAKLQQAIAAAAAGNVATACNLLRAFINETRAQSGKALTLEAATLLIAEANQIRASLGCP